MMTANEVRESFQEILQKEKATKLFHQHLWLSRMTQR